MKKGKKLLLLLLTLVLLVGATAAVSLTGKEAAYEEDTAETVFSLNPESVTSLGWDYSEKISFTAGENGWVCDQDGAFPVDETYLDAMLDTLTEVKSTKAIEDPENLDQYGLEVPVCVVTVTAGESYTLSIGLETAMGSQRYFSNGDGNVYLVDGEIIDCFQYGLYDVLKHQTLPSVSDLTGITVQTSGGSYAITRQENSGLAYSDEYVWFMDGKALDNELTQTLLTRVTNLNLSRCVDYDADDLSVYGLDSPTVTVTVLDGGEAAFTLEIGAAKGDECYLRLGGSKMIYQVDAQFSDTLCYTTYADLQPDEVLLMDWNTVKSVAVTLDGREYELVRGLEEKTDDEGNATEETVWKLDGTETEFASVLESLTAMTSSGYAGGTAPEREPEIAFRIYRDRENFSEVELAFYSYNSASCLVTLDGTPTVTVKRETVADLVESVSKLLKI